MGWGPPWRWWLRPSSTEDRARATSTRCRSSGPPALLGAPLGEAQDPAELAESGRSVTAAPTAVLRIAGDLPPGVRAQWLSRPELVALLAG